LWLYQLGGSTVDSAFVHGHVALTSIWVALGVAAIAIATPYRNADAHIAAAGWLALVAVKAAGFDADRLPHGLAGWSLLAVGGGLLAATLLVYLIDRGAALVSPLAVVGVTAALGFSLRAATWLAPAHSGLAVA